MTWIINRSATIAFSTGIGNSSLVTRRIRDYNDVQQAVYDVYGANSIIARTMPGRPRITNPDIQTILNTISKRIYAYFNGKPNTVHNQVNFDNFHNELCDYFKNQYNTIFASTTTQAIEYGISQKLINIVFKYLACYSDYIDFADLFSYCHIPIDSIILYLLAKKYHISSIKSSRSVSAKTGKVSYSAKYRGKAWSKLTYDLYVDLVNNYRQMIFDIQSHCWLAVDFYCWSWNGVGDAPELPAAGTPVTHISRFYK